MLSGMNLPDFESPEWNAERERLQEQMAAAVVALVTHMSGPGPLCGKFDLQDPSGRPISLTIDAGARPRPN